jgi:hypothetical protein
MRIPLKCCHSIQTRPYPAPPGRRSPGRSLWITLAIGIIACLASAAPVWARTGPECVRDWAWAIGGPDLPGAYGANLRHERELYQRYFSSWNRVDFIAYQCRTDRKLTRQIILDEIRTIAPLEGVKPP